MRISSGNCLSWFGLGEPGRARHHRTGRSRRHEASGSSVPGRSDDRRTTRQRRGALGCDEHIVAIEQHGIDVDAGGQERSEPRRGRRVLTLLRARATIRVIARALDHGRRAAGRRGEAARGPGRRVGDPGRAGHHDPRHEGEEHGEAALAHGSDGRKVASVCSRASVRGGLPGPNPGHPARTRATLATSRARDRAGFSWHGG